MKSKYSFALQIASAGYYAEIEISSSEGVVSQLKIPPVYSDWEVGLNFGIALFNRWSPNSPKQRVCVDVLKTNPVDTTQVIVSYVLFTVLATRFNPDILDNFSFNEESGLFLLQR
jgi:hypothetical protein